MASPGADGLVRPRPDWVRALNASAASAGGPSALVPLDEGSLRVAAADVGGDVADPDFPAEAFGLLVDGLESTAELHTVGRLLARSELVTALRARRQVLSARAEAPAVADERIVEPLFVTGTGRSGTSILLELLACDPGNRALLTFETLAPVAPVAPDRRVDEADAAVRFWDHVTPEYRTMHENGGEVPQECTSLFAHCFVGDAWTGQYRLPALQRWQLQHGLRAGYAWHHDVLQLLAHRSGATQQDRTWVLKAPMHLVALATLFERYPDATVVITHRDPARVMGSLVSLMATLRWMRSDEVDVARLARTVIPGLAGLLDWVDTERAAGTLPAERIVDVHYAELMADPVATVASLYERCGRSLGSEAAARISAYVTAKPRARHGVHRYDLGATGFDAGALEELFAGYRARHDIPAEPAEPTGPVAAGGVS
ncbi:MAG: sulfotransferase [Acidimicrobiales bacterium]|jgi:hypothetical protein|nr:sulfotransferase [Acidimicrobiales bacterium]